MRVLAGDIGGTKTRLAVFDIAGSQLDTLAEHSYRSSDFASLDAVIETFLEDRDAAGLQACFGIAGPVRAGRSQVTNLPWIVEADPLRARFGFARVALINDLEANAWGIQALTETDFDLLNTGHPEAAGNASIIAAGTGLGEAGLYWDGQRHWPFASEGGHGDFSPQSRLEMALLEHLLAHFDHVSWERVVSGMGLVNVHAFLCEYRHTAIPEGLAERMRNDDPAAVISTAALENEDALCREALDLFIYLYGAEAGNHALKIMATGGVYIGGGIAPKVFTAENTHLFMEGFLKKGRMRPLLESMPVRMIHNDRTALYGPAVYLAATAGQGVQAGENKP